MNWVLLLARNNLALTRKAMKTLLAQDIGDIHVLVINNGSTDGTAQWLQIQKGNVFQLYPGGQVSVASAWNKGLRFVFATQSQYCLVVNNDIELRPDTYRHLIDDGGGFITAVGVRDPDKIRPLIADGESEDGRKVKIELWPLPDPASKRPHPDFSCYLIRRQTWEKVGEFDEHFGIAFCEDWDYHCRLHQAGIRAECLDLPFLHHGSMTIKTADLAEQQRIATQAERNREYFKKKWGFAGGSPEYYAFFGHDRPVPIDAPSTG